MIFSSAFSNSYSDSLSGSLILTSTSYGMSLSSPSSRLRISSIVSGVFFSTTFSWGAYTTWASPSISLFPSSGKFSFSTSTTSCSYSSSSLISSFSSSPLRPCKNCIFFSLFLSLKRWLLWRIDCRSSILWLLLFSCWIKLALGFDSSLSVLCINAGGGPSASSLSTSLASGFLIVFWSLY